MKITSDLEHGAIVSEAGQTERISLKLLEVVRKYPGRNHIDLNGDVLTVRASNGIWKYRLHPSPEDTDSVMATMIEKVLIDPMAPKANFIEGQDGCSMAS